MGDHLDGDYTDYADRTNQGDHEDGERVIGEAYRRCGSVDVSPDCSPAQAHTESVTKFVQPLSIPANLDAESEAYLRDVLTLLIARRPDLLAAILYGSVARGQARPLTDPDPSDMDVLLVFAPEPGSDEVSSQQGAAASWAKIEVIARYPAARDLHFVLATPTFARWDVSFVENVARDGILLWARELLPPALHTIVDHQSRQDNDRVVAGAR